MYNQLILKKCTLCPHSIYIFSLSENKQLLVPLTTKADRFLYHRFNPFKPNGYFMHHQFNIVKLNP